MAEEAGGEPAQPRQTDSIAVPAEPSSPAPEEPKMEFHKPKPFHNWREFLAELAIVVLGVCIALAAEQAVEWLHWQGEVVAARAAIKAEIANNDLWFVQRIAIATCMDRQAREAGRMLADLEAGRRPGSFTAYHPGFGSLLNDSEWQSARAATTLTHFPRDELAMMSLYYGVLSVFHQWIDQEGDAWRELSVLQNPPASISASDLLRLRTALSTVRDMEALIILRAPDMLRNSGQLGVAPPAPNAQFVKKFCTSSGIQALNPFAPNIRP